MGIISKRFGEAGRFDFPGSRNSGGLGDQQRLRFDGRGGQLDALTDGKVLFASDHPLVKAGGTQSNILATAADLDVASLELALTDWELIVSHEGFLQMQTTPRV